jgi:hypothetical protein
MSPKLRQLRGHLRQLVGEYKEADPIVGDLLAETIQRSLEAIISERGTNKAPDSIQERIDQLYEHKDRYVKNDL